MKWLVVTLMLLKLGCVIRDPEHEIFRPISMYQTVEYAYSGTLYVALLAVASALMLRKLFRSRFAEQLIGVIVATFCLTCLLMLLTLANISYTAFHTLIAMGGMVGFGCVALFLGRAFSDPVVTGLSMSALALCVVPAAYLPSFGVVENVVLVVMLATYWYLYDVTLELGRLAPRRS